MKISFLALLVGTLITTSATAVECPKKKQQTASASQCHKTWTGKVVCKPRT